MDYGEKLKKIIQNAEASKIDAECAQIEKRNRAALKERMKIERLVADLNCDIMYAIERGTIPNIDVKNYALQDLVKDALTGNSKYQDVWNQFTKNLQASGLKIKITHAHDGMGMESWLIISVDPLE